MADDDRAVEARALHPTARAWLRRRGARGTRPCPRHDPLGRSYQRCRPPVVRAVEAWAEMMNRKADGWGSAGSDSERTGRRAGMLVGLLGLREHVGQRS